MVGLYFATYLILIYFYCIFLKLISNYLKVNYKWFNKFNQNIINIYNSLTKFKTIFLI